VPTSSSNRFARSASPLLARVCEHDRDKRRRLLGRGHCGGDQASWDEATAQHLRERIARTPGTDSSRMMLAACYGHLGRLEDARMAWAELLKVNPGFSLVLLRFRSVEAASPDGQAVQHKTGSERQNHNQ
jgi:Flp pilus assembly protein TadD